MESGEKAASIGQSVKLKGELSGTENLEFNGEIQGSILLEGGRLTVGASGKVYGDVSATEVVVLGNVQGDIRVTGRVDLRHSAVVQGKIFATKLQIEPGADLHVTVIDTTSSDNGNLSKGLGGN